MKKLFASLALLAGLLSPALAQNFTLGTYGATDATGWSTFTAKPHGTGSCAGRDETGTCAIYLSRAAANDSLCALTTVGDTTKPCRTIAGAMGVIRNGFPDWVLFRKGDTWNDDQIISDDGITANFSKTGLSDTDFLVLSNYDPASPSVVNPPTGGARPILNIPIALDGMTCGGGGSACAHVAVVGLEFYNYQADPNVTGRTTILGGNTGIKAVQIGFPHLTVIEDVKISWFSDNFAPQGLSNANNKFIFRRSQLVNAYGTNFHGEGARDSPQIIEENVIEGGSNTIVTGTATVTGGSPVVINWPNGMGGGATSQSRWVTFSPGCSALTAGVQYYPLNNNHTTFNVATTDGSSTAVNGTCATATQTITWYVATPTGFNWSSYINELDTDSGNFAGPMQFRGNIVSNPPGSQFRPCGGTGSGTLAGGGVISNNAFINGQEAHNCFNFTDDTTTTVITNNVYLGTKPQPPGGNGNVDAFSVGGSNYNSRAAFLGTFSVTNNIIANATATTSTSGGLGKIDLSAAATVNYSGNITYNYNPSGGGTSVFNPLAVGGGAIRTGHIVTGGTGYTDHSFTITSVTTNSFGRVEFGVTPTTDTIFGPDKYFRFYPTGLGGSGCPLNGNAYYGRAQNPDTSHIQLYEPSTQGTCTMTGSSSPKLYYPVFGAGSTTAFTTSETGCTGSTTGSGGTTAYISSGGVIVDVALYGGEGVNPQPGHGYTIGDTLCLNGGSGFKYQIDTVSVLTAGTNPYDPTGATPSAYPGCASPSATTSPNNCMPAKYYDLITRTAGHTEQDFVNAILANHKGNWNPLLMGNTGLVPWIQAGFGIGHAFGTTNP